MTKKDTLYFYPWDKNKKRRPHSISIHGTRISKEDHTLFLSKEQEYLKNAKLFCCCCNKLTPPVSLLVNTYGQSLYTANNVQFVYSQTSHSQGSLPNMNKIFTNQIKFRVMKIQKSFLKHFLFQIKFLF
jgi:hypothetical protein